MIKLLGVLDVLIALFYLLAVYGIGTSIGTILVIVLLVKSLIFISDWTSWVDIIIGGYFFLIILDIHSLFAFIGFLWLAQRGFFSLAY